MGEGEGGGVGGGKEIGKVYGENKVDVMMYGVEKWVEC